MHAMCLVLLELRTRCPKKNLQLSVLIERMDQCYDFETIFAEKWLFDLKKIAIFAQNGP
jgi:hypothetical protein